MIWADSMNDNFFNQTETEAKRVKIKKRMERKMLLVSIALLFIVLLPQFRSEYIMFDMIYATTMHDLFPFITNTFLETVPIIYLFVLLAVLYLIGMLITFIRMQLSKTKGTQTLIRRYRRFDFVGFLVYLMAFYIFINAFWFSLANVEGRSMEPTFYDGDTIVMRHRQESYDRFKNVVVDPEYEAADFFIKRIIGLPGETVTITGGSVYIDENELDESAFIPPGVETYCEPGFPGEHLYCEYELDHDEYFIMGDNRQDSMDSRYGIIGAVNEEQIYGTVEFRVFPFSGFGQVN